MNTARHAFASQKGIGIIAAPPALRDGIGTNRRSSRFLEIQPQFRRVNQMDKDRIKGSAKQAKGAVKEAVGQVTGDAKSKAEGKTEKAAGKVQNAIGGLKDAARGK